MKTQIKITVDAEGNGETTFTLPKSWESAHKKGKEGVPRYFYLKSGNLEFPQAYYVANPNKTDEKEKQNKNRIKALMLKVAKNLTKDEATEKNNAVILGEEFVGVKKEETCTCPNCNKPVTVQELKQIFTSADDATLKKVADTYTKYMKEFKMDTCWNKAHFFAQAAVESGLSFTLSKGEGMNYLADDLYKGRWNLNKNKYDIIFSYFHNNRESYLYGRKEEFKNHKKIITQKANQEMIANLAYGPNSTMGKILGNTGKEDGWNFRGKGCIQLTGRGNYEAANKYTLKYENVNILNNPDAVATDIKIAVLTSMAFFDYNKINKIANGTKNVKGKICPKVGNDVTLANGKSNYSEKQEIFDENTSKIFKIDSCKFIEEEKSNNKPFIVRLVRKWQTNKSTIGEFTIDDTDIKGYILEEKGPDTTTSGKEQRIPVGTYNLVWHNGTKFKNVLKVYNKDVPIERAILIHKGNTADNTEGCLLPGLSRKADRVDDSKTMFDKINAEAKKRGLTNSKLIITANYEN